MSELGYGDGYAYDHDAEDGFSGQDYFPEDMRRQSLYSPIDRGFEREVRKRMVYWSDLRAKRSSG
jgi:putative ATPase